VGAVLNLRRPIWESDESVVVHVARLLRSFNTHQLNADGLIATRTSIYYAIEGRQVCRTYWSIVMGISDHTLRRSRLMAKTGRFVTTHAGIGLTKGTIGDGSPGSTEASDGLKCHAFWMMYFDVMCQRPNDEVRLFPTAETFPSLYQSQFLPHVERMGWTKTPGERVFTKIAKNHRDFADVKRKKNHTHCRCDECSDCRALLAAGFRNGADLEDARQRWQRHQGAVKDWRECENYWTQRSQSTPHEVITPCGPPVLLSRMCAC
jgi:hypothetical protein